jgi:hypothetical protein
LASAAPIFSPEVMIVLLNRDRTDVRRQNHCRRSQRPRQAFLISLAASATGLPSVRPRLSASIISSVAAAFASAIDLSAMGH